jgi:hypothetical protein
MEDFNPWQLTQQCWPSGRRDRYHRSLRVQPAGERREEEHAGSQEAGRRCWPGEPEQAAGAQSETEESGRRGAWAQRWHHGIGEA